MSYRMPPVPASIGSWCLRQLVEAIDALLRRVLAITELESEGEDLFRVHVGPAERALLLSDGTRVERGDIVMELHLWNEKLGPYSGARFELGWAVRFRRQVIWSLRRLAVQIRRDPRLAAIRAIHMQPAIERRKPMGAAARMLQKIGFEPVPSMAPGCVFRFLENLWLWLLTWAHNPQSLRGREFDRARCEFWISRPRFLARYGDGFVEPRGGAEADRSELSSLCRGSAALQAHESAE